MHYVEIVTAMVCMTGWIATAMVSSIAWIAARMIRAATESFDILRYGVVH